MNLNAPIKTLEKVQLDDVILVLSVVICAGLLILAWV